MQQFSGRILLESANNNITAVECLNILLYLISTEWMLMHLNVRCEHGHVCLQSTCTLQTNLTFKCDHNVTTLYGRGRMKKKYYRCSIIVIIGVCFHYVHIQNNIGSNGWLKNVSRQRGQHFCEYNLLAYAHAFTLKFMKFHWNLWKPHYFTKC